MNDCKQYSIFDFLIYDEDDVFKGIQDLKKDEEFIFYNTKITRYQDHFEVENDMVHERHDNIRECYEWLLSNVN